MPRSRPPLRPGAVTRTLEHNAEVRRRLDDARAQHGHKLADLSARRAEVQAADLSAQARATRLSRIAAAEVAEADRHRRALARLRERLR